MAQYPASGLTPAGKVPYPLGDDYIDTDGHLADMAWAIDPRLIQQHTTLGEAEARNSSTKALRRRGQIVYLTSTRGYYAWVGPSVTVHGVTADAEGWIPLARLLIAQGTNWGKVSDLMPTVGFRVGLDTNLSSTGTITVLTKTITMPAHPVTPGGLWRAGFWAVCRLHYTAGQYALRGYINNVVVFHEVFHYNNEASSRMSHTTPVGIAGGAFREKSSVTFTLKAERLSGSGTMDVDDAPSIAESIIWPEV
jgi:hypothetical protein